MAPKAPIFRPFALPPPLVKGQISQLQREILVRHVLILCTGFCREIGLVFPFLLGLNPEKKFLLLKGNPEGFSSVTLEVRLYLYLKASIILDYGFIEEI